MRLHKSERWCQKLQQPGSVVSRTGRDVEVAVISVDVDPFRALAGGIEVKAAP